MSRRIQESAIVLAGSPKNLVLSRPVSVINEAERSASEIRETAKYGSFLLDRSVIILVYKN